MDYRSHSYKIAPTTNVSDCYMSPQGYLIYPPSAQQSSANSLSYIMPQNMQANWVNRFYRVKLNESSIFGRITGLHERCINFHLFLRMSTH